MCYEGGVKGPSGTAWGLP